MFIDDLSAVVDRLGCEYACGLLQEIAGLYTPHLPVYVAPEVIVGGDSCLIHDSSLEPTAIFLAREDFRTRFPGGHRLSPTNSRIYETMYHALMALVGGDGVEMALTLERLRGVDPLTSVMMYRNMLERVALEEYRSVRPLIHSDGTKWKGNVRLLRNRKKVLEGVQQLLAEQMISCFEPEQYLHEEYALH